MLKVGPLRTLAVSTLAHVLQIAKHTKPPQRHIAPSLLRPATPLDQAVIELEKYGQFRLLIESPPLTSGAGRGQRGLVRCRTRCRLLCRGPWIRQEEERDNLADIQRIVHRNSTAKRRESRINKNNYSCKVQLRLKNGFVCMPGELVA